MFDGRTIVLRPWVSRVVIIKDLHEGMVLNRKYLLALSETELRDWAKSQNFTKYVKFESVPYVAGTVIFFG